MLIGYMRPYQGDLNCEIQHKNISQIKCDQVVTEEISSAKKRIKLKNMINNLHQGDKIVVTKLFALADSTRHLVELLDAIDAKGCYLQSLNEGIDTSNGAVYGFKDIVKHLVDFQSDVISEKTKQGLYDAKQKGVVTGRPRKSDENVKRAITMYESKKYSLAEIKEQTGISKSTLYRYLES
ncbi:recombinase family protein [Mesobacillus foraminis]|uniref:recombinase family protein n=1 Tax=Mesobacillus foraminis TaxID=279826 RepID=UPI001BECE277|nr:recombinase family protein [Mesobacillus foraminis]MBT2756885.1 recombinase family protein [Mesobacillus foraminis]